MNVIIKNNNKTNLTFVGLKLNMSKPDTPPDSGGTTSTQSSSPTKSTNAPAATKKSKENNYYFINYMRNKERILNSIRQNETRITWKFNNTVKLINSKKIQLVGKDIFNSIKTQINIDTTKIKTITSSKSKKVWMIEFNDSNEFPKVLDKEIEINGNIFNLIDANTTPQRNQTVTLKAILRIHWLPPNFKKEKVSRVSKRSF